MGKNIKKALWLYMYFFKIGWYTFGGGWSIVAQIERDFVSKRKELTSAQLLDIVSVGRSLPGMMIGNVSFLFGFHQAGILGGILSLIGVATPPLIILCGVTYFYQRFHDSYYVAKALTGVRAVVVPIILSAVLKLHKSAFPKPVCYGICVCAVLLSFVVKISCVWIILCGVLFGLVFAPVTEKEVHD